MPVVEELLQQLRPLQLQPKPQQLQPKPHQLRPQHLQQLQLEDLEVQAVNHGGLVMVFVIQKTIRLNVYLIEVIAALLTLTPTGTIGAKELT